MCPETLGGSAEEDQIYRLHLSFLMDPKFEEFLAFMQTRSTRQHALFLGLEEETAKLTALKAELEKVPENRQQLVLKLAKILHCRYAD